MLTAIKTPIRELGTVQTVTNTAVLNQSILTILTTPVGESFFNPAFGSRLTKLLFEPNSDVLQDLIQVLVREALSKWEPRIRIQNLKVTVGTQTAEVSITYTTVQGYEQGLFTYIFQRTY